MFVNLIEKLRSVYGISRPKGAACTAAHEVQKVKFHDLDRLSGSWIADEEFDVVVKAFDLIDRPRDS
jgi:hypothetical protein